MKHFTLFSFLSLIACGKLPEFRFRSSEVKQNVTSIYSSSRLVIKVFYETGAEPYTDKIAVIKSWELLQKNLEALFDGKKVRPQIIVPKELSEMTKLENFNKVTWSNEDIASLATTTKSLIPDETTTFHIYFLKGFSSTSHSTIGMHLNGTKTIAIFKDVIRASATSIDPIVPKYVEQATLVHEMGHALGLVNNGIPMVSSHQDSAHGSHCSNPDCVMYHSNEGSTSMMSFAVQAMNKLSIVMFDQQCLIDAQNFQK